MVDSITLASNYRLLAVSFWESAKVLSESCPYKKNNPKSVVTISPFFYLSSHACELFLKSSLLKRDITEQDLKRRNIRHDLIKLLKILEEKSVVITKDTKEVIHKLNDVHSTHKLR